jgi:hypothetical protein
MHIWTSHDVFWLENEGVPCFREWQPMEHYLGSSACIDWAAAKGLANCLFIKEWKQV